MTFREFSFQGLFSADLRRGLRICAFDLEAPAGNLDLGAVCGEQSHRELLEKAPLGQLDAVLGGFGSPDVVLGHNILGFDLPRLRERAQGAQILDLPAIDTLYLSPLAFPENPYHRLIKGYKLSGSTPNDPVADARLSLKLFGEEREALERIERSRPGTLSLFRMCFEAATDLLGDNGGLALALEEVGATPIASDAARAIFEAVAEHKACRAAVQDAWTESEAPKNARRRLAIAYAAAWLPVAGDKSVIPRWVRETFPEVRELVERLRDVPCASDDCQYCRETHDATSQLKRWFGYDDFRSSPRADDGTSLQRKIVEHGMFGGSHLAILPTGGGKSLCFQLPAIVRNFRRGALTIVLSPLQALMRDQVTNLSERTRTNAAALYGLLTPLERGQVLRQIQLGDISVLYVSPEQLRNRSFEKAVIQREIGGWVFDEAHCLSKWGHDFRPDYLFACKVMKRLAERQRVPIPPVACLTATARVDVIEEICAHFKRELGIELARFEGGLNRENLSFSVEAAPEQQKWDRVLALCSEVMNGEGSVVVYYATRRTTEKMAERLIGEGLPAVAFHGGLEDDDKKRALDGFIDKTYRIVCATNAFGMGVDKPDVRLVVHADIPGTLENYLQEAGRAGRDGGDARCVLLFDERDVERQFELLKMSEIGREDMVQILRGIRKLAKRSTYDLFVTSGEILRDDLVDASFEAGDFNADTKVKTAVSWLERAGFLTRDLNETKVWTGRPAVPSSEEGLRRIELLGLPSEQRRMWIAILRAMLDLAADDGLTIDEVAGLPEFTHWLKAQRTDDAVLRLHRVVLEELRAMVAQGLVTAGATLTVYVNRLTSKRRFNHVEAIEKALLHLLPVQAPEAEHGDWCDVSPRQLNEALRAKVADADLETTRSVLEGLGADMNAFGREAGLVVRPRSFDGMTAKLRGTWAQLVERARRRRTAAGACLEAIRGRIPSDATGKQLVELTLEELVETIRLADLFDKKRFEGKEVEAVERILLFLHDRRCLVLHRGFAIFRAAMSIRVETAAAGRRYTRDHYAPLAEHYEGRTMQAHVMRRYAVLGMKSPEKAADLVGAYFDLPNKRFLSRFFRGEGEQIRRPISVEGYRRIVDDLAHDTQQQIVTAPATESQLVLAGPGSGKTKVVVHRCAYLLRVLRVPRASVLVLCFNRRTVFELRRRLAELFDGPVRGLRIHTYDGLAMRIVGRSFAGDGAPPDFESVRREAIALLTGTADVGLPADELRDRLLRGFRHILVDEYQDIDESQYDLVSAIAGRTTRDREERLSILAVGDDDQNIYDWRGASTQFIERFVGDYDAKEYELLDNYRSTPSIVRVANELISERKGRMKSEAIRSRIEDTGDEPERIGVDDAAHQAGTVVDRLAALRGGVTVTSDVAVLARNWDELTAVRLLCRARNLPVRWAAEPGVGSMLRLRETRRLRASLLTKDNVTAGWLRSEVRRIEQACGASRWTLALLGLVDEWEVDVGPGPRPSSDFDEFLCDALAERRQTATVERGIFAGTVHAAKGMEFDRVCLLGGGWQDTDADRRLFYVGVTRAKRNLEMFVRADHAHPFVSGSMERAPPTHDDIPPWRIGQLGLSDLFLDYAGRKATEHTVHPALARLRIGTELAICHRGDHTYLVEPTSGVEVAALSAKAATQWRSRNIEALHVEAIVIRKKSESDGNYRDLCRVDEWELPLVEVLYVD